MIQVHVFRKGQEVRDVPVAKLSEVRTEPRTLVWVDVVSATPEELAAMGEEFQLHEMALASCAARAKQRPRVEEYEGQVLLIAYAAKAVGEGRPVELHELDMIAGRIEDLEEAVFEASVDVQNQIFSLRRDLIAIRRVAGPMRDALIVLLRRDLPALPPGHLRPHGPDRGASRTTRTWPRGRWRPAWPWSPTGSAWSPATWAPMPPSSPWSP